MKRYKLNQRTWAWALYDWANSAFATTVMAGFFPIFYKQYWAGALESTQSTFYLGLGNSVASTLILLCAPILGALADRLQRKKTLLILFACVGISMTAGLFLVEQGHWFVAIGIYCVAVFGFMGANMFYDAMIVAVSDENNRDLVSAVGYAVGYLGGGILFSINVAMTLAPAWFGIADAGTAVRLSFLSVAVWWTVFSVPLLLLVNETRTARVPTWPVALRESAAAVLVTVKEIIAHRVVALFLLAYWFYIDGLDTIVHMAVDYGVALGIGQNDLIVALIITQFVGFPATLLFGHIAQKYTAIGGLYIGISAYLVFIVWAFFMSEPWEFYCLAGGIGLVQGSVQALSRSYYVGLIPTQKAASYFGFYNMVGKSAVILGPLMIGVVGLLTGSHRWGILSVSLLFIVGGILLWRVNQRVWAQT